MHQLLRQFKYRIAIGCISAGLLMILFLGANALAASAAKIEKMAYSELNQIITQGDGHYLLIFMAAWCGPCKEELPTLNRLFHRFKDQGVRFIGISIDAGGPAAMERVLKKRQVNFSVFWVGETAVDELKLVGIPMIYLVKNGRIVEKIPGKCSYKFLEGRILDFIK